MPEVQGIAALACLREGGNAEEAPHQRGVRTRDAPHEKGREDGSDKHAAPVHEVAVAIERKHHGHDTDKGENRDEVICQRRHAAATKSWDSPLEPQTVASCGNGEKSAHEKLRGASVKAIVDSGRVCRGVEEHAHGNRRGYRKTKDDETCIPTRGNKPREQQKHRGPQDIELHDDAEVPEVR